MAETFFPTEPRSVDDTGLGLLFLSELAMKTLYLAGQMTGFELAQAMRLSFPGVVSRVVDFMKREHYCETRGTGGLGEASYQYSVTEKGGAKAREALWRNQYAGPAPVTLAEYGRAVRVQSAPQAELGRGELEQALAHLVLSPALLDDLGPAVASRHSLMLHGASGNGRTRIARALADLLCRDHCYIPYAVEAGGEIILLHDDSLHERIADGAAPNGETGGAGPRQDGRWVRIRRPVIALGSELRLEGMEPSFGEITRCYTAPPQLKANNGVAIVDDLGRQTAPPGDLLNRWVGPLDSRSDHLTLRTGLRLQFPFEAIVIFATHLDARDLAGAAHLRRIRHSVTLRDPTFDEYREIFRRACGAQGIPYNEDALAHLLQKYYIQRQVPMRASHPDEILKRLGDIAKYQSRTPSLASDLLEQACRIYFAQIGETKGALAQ